MAKFSFSSEKQYLCRMKALRYILASIAIMMAAMAVSAQQTQPVRWRTIVKVSPDGSRGTVTFKALISPGWHLYDTSLPDGGPKPTSIDLSGSEGIVFTTAPKASREPAESFDDMFGLKLAWWDANVDFSAPFKVTDADKARLKASITYMACDGSTCQPPRTENISTAVKATKK